MYVMAQTPSAKRRIILEARAHLKDVIRWVDNDVPNFVDSHLDNEKIIPVSLEVDDPVRSFDKALRLLRVADGRFFADLKRPGQLGRLVDYSSASVTGKLTSGYRRGAVLNLQAMAQKAVERIQAYLEIEFPSGAPSGAALARDPVREESRDRSTNEPDQGEAHLGPVAHSQESTGLPSDRYEIVEEIGRGASGVVYRAFDSDLKREVAIKQLSLQEYQPEHHDEMRKRFLKEAQALARMRHPHIVSIHDYATVGGKPCLILELIEGDTLEDRIENAPLDVSEALKFLLPVLDALEYAHGQQVIHRDVKPGNIFVSYDGIVKLGDFGLALFSEPEITKFTLSGQKYLGTPGYIAPELIDDFHVASAQSDYYSIGVTLFRLVAGRLPGAGDNLERLLPNAPSGLQECFIRCSHADRGKRYKTTAEMRKDIQDLIDKAGLAPHGLADSDARTASGEESLPLGEQLDMAYESQVYAAVESTAHRASNVYQPNAEEMNEYCRRALGRFKDPLTSSQVLQHFISTMAHCSFYEAADTLATEWVERTLDGDESTKDLYSSLSDFFRHDVRCIEQIVRVYRALAQGSPPARYQQDVFTALNCLHSIVRLHPLLITQSRRDLLLAVADDAFKADEYRSAAGQLFQSLTGKKHPPIAQNAEATSPNTQSSIIIDESVIESGWVTGTAKPTIVDEQGRKALAPAEKEFAKYLDLKTGVGTNAYRIASVALLMKVDPAGTNHPEQPDYKTRFCLYLGFLLNNEPLWLRYDPSVIKRHRNDKNTEQEEWVCPLRSDCVNGQWQEIVIQPHEHLQSIIGDRTGATCILNSFRFRGPYCLSEIRLNLR